MRDFCSLRFVLIVFLLPLASWASKFSALKNALVARACWVSNGTVHYHLSQVVSHSMPHLVRSKGTLKGYSTHVSHGTDSHRLAFIPIPPEPCNYSVKDSPLRILFSRYRPAIPLVDARKLFRHVAFDIFVNMQLFPNWVIQPMTATYRKEVGVSVFSVSPTGMRYEDLGMLAA